LPFSLGSPAVKTEKCFYAHDDLMDKAGLVALQTGDRRRGVLYFVDTKADKIRRGAYIALTYKDIQDNSYRILRGAALSDDPALSGFVCPQIAGQ
jgi:hypothetical protein